MSYLKQKPELNFTENQISVMCGNKRICGKNSWTTEELAEGAYQFGLSHDLYRHFYTANSRRFPHPSANAVLAWLQKHTERHTCTVKGCPQHRKTCYTKAQFDKHMAAHGKVVCEHCGAGFKSNSTLARHVVPVHFGIKQWKCGICAHDFAKEENLEVHLAVTHLKLCANDKGFKANRAHCKPAIEGYKQKLAVEVVDSRTAVITHPEGTKEEINISSPKQSKKYLEAQNGVLLQIADDTILMSEK